MSGFLRNIDIGLIVPIFILILLSLTALFSINFSIFKSQLIFVSLGILAFLFFSQVNYKAIQFYATPIYIVSIVLLLLVLVLGIESRGAIRWVEIAGFRIQFSEILKPFLAISLASFITLRDRSLSSFLTATFFLSITAGLIFFQPDLGSSIIYILVFVLTLIYFGFSLKFFAASAALLLTLAPILWSFLKDYQRDRLLTFINPGHDPLGKSYNAIQSIIAVGSGELSGRGLGQGTQSGLSFLPERHTDFIFATISEQLGFIGSSLIIICFAFMLYRILKISIKSEDIFCKVFAIVCFFAILVQFFLNIGMNIGILPVVGITLPFVSYGGSSLLASFILLGLVSSMVKNTKEPRVLEIR